MKTKPILSISLLVVVATLVPAQSSPPANLNSYYRFPLSATVSYQQLSGIGNRELADFTISEIAGELRVPLPGLPVVQPLLRGGIVNYAFVGDLETERQDWSHRHIFVGPGVGYSLRISREFEVGAEGFAAITQSVFNKLDLPADDGSRGQLNLMGGVAARLALNPSYNISIGVTPALRYLRGLGSLNVYDGLTFGIGFGASYRFGRDPDAAQAEVRAIRFVEAEIPPVFAAMQSYYVSEPLGAVTIANTESTALTDVDVSFVQPGFMDSPTFLVHYDEIEPAAEITVPVRAAFNDQVFTTQGVTPLNGEIIVAYSVRGRPAEQRHSITYDLHDRNALTWDDDRKVAAFITPQDSAVRNYASFVRQATREEQNDYLSANLQFAMQAYDALTELGILYQIDPTSPFVAAQENTLVVDSISLPRETLVRRTGDCDDLTVLYNTMLQAVGIQTAFVTVPGHIFSAFNTGVASQDHGTVHPDRTMTIDLDGQLWVLVEITLVGRSGFMEAWSTGIAEYRQYDENPQARGFYPTAMAQEVFRPVALRETDLGLQYGDEDAIARRFTADLDQLTGAILQPFATRANETGRARDWNAYGIAAAQFGSVRRARQAFARVLEIEPSNLNAQLNLGSLHYLDGEYSQALRTFLAAEETLDGRRRSRESTRLSLYLNISKTQHALGHFDEARGYLTRAEEIDATEAARFSYLGTGTEDAATAGATETGRASAAAGAVPILFFADE